MDFWSRDVLEMTLSSITDKKKLVQIAWENHILDNPLVVRRLQELEGQKVSIFHMSLYNIT